MSTNENIGKSQMSKSTNQSSPSPSPTKKPPDTEIKEQRPQSIIEVKQSTEVSINQEIPLFYLDRAAPLDRNSFPNQPMKEGKPPKATIANIHHLLKSYGVKISYDVINKQLKIILPNYAGSSENASNVALTQILSLAAMNGMSPGAIPAILEVLGDRNPYNPVANWIMSKPWDGQNRLQLFYETLVEQEDFPKSLKEVLMRRWLISAVAAALMPQGFYCRGVLTLQGRQTIGKTSWIRALIPEPMLRERVLKLDHHLDASNKDSLITAVTHWIVEIGELDSSLRKDVARLKGFITSDRDKLRRPYARSDSDYQRRTVFTASVNEHAFLVDATGNTRFWTIPVSTINFQHGIEMQQLWAQVAIEFQNGESWWLTQAEEDCLESFNNDHRAISVIREQILAKVDLARKGDPSLKAMSAIELLREIGNDRPSNPQCKECAGILRELFGDPKKLQGIYKWRIPLKAGKFDKLLPDPINDDDKY